MQIPYTLNALKPVASQLIKHFSSKTVLFYGDMGVGKTTLIKTLVKTLGSSDEVTSPTFSIVNEYELPNDKIYHFDLYRIETIEEAYNFGIEEYLFSNHWVFVEWPEKIESLLTDDFNHISLNLVSETERVLELGKF